MPGAHSSAEYSREPAAWITLGAEPWPAAFGSKRLFMDKAPSIGHPLSIGGVGPVPPLRTAPDRAVSPTAGWCVLRAQPPTRARSPTAPGSTDDRRGGSGPDDALLPASTSDRDAQPAARRPARRGRAGAGGAADSAIGRAGGAGRQGAARPGHPRGGERAGGAAARVPPAPFPPFPGPLPGPPRRARRPPPRPDSPARGGTTGVVRPGCSPTRAGPARGSCSCP
jgi:hypothetical protein